MGVLLGPEGSQTGLHIDTHRLPFWIAVVGPSDRPLKRVRIFPHDDMGILKYGRSSNTTNFHFDFDPWRPDFKRHPGVADSVVYEADLWSGEMLYIPGGSPHAVVNLADNLGVSMNYLDLKTMPTFVKKCSKGSPLCGVLAGKGEWVITALQERQLNEKPLSYFEFAGLRDRSDFCKAQLAAREGGTVFPAPHEYCA